MKTLGILLLAAIVWTQVTPSDNKGCAGYTPTIVKEEPPPQPYQPDPPYQPTQEMQDPESDSGSDDYNPTIGDNQGKGQFDEPSQDNQW